MRNSVLKQLGGNSLEGAQLQKPYWNKGARNVVPYNGKSTKYFSIFFRFVLRRLIELGLGIGIYRHTSPRCTRKVAGRFARFVRVPCENSPSWTEKALVQRNSMEKDKMWNWPRENLMSGAKNEKFLRETIGRERKMVIFVDFRGSFFSGNKGVRKKSKPYKIVVFGHTTPRYV